LNKIKIDDFKMSTLFRNKQFLDLILSDKKWIKNDIKIIYNI
jgi:hypothetical protein